VPIGNSKCISNSSAQSVKKKFLNSASIKLEPDISFVLNGKQEAHMTGDLKNQQPIDFFIQHSRI
jgi:hypothetical protein